MFMSLVRKVVRRFLPLANSGPLVGPTFFSSYEEALSRCANSKGYQEEALVEVVVEKNRLYREKVAADPVFDLEDYREIIGVAASGHSRPLRVIDFGGGAGAHFTVVNVALSPTLELRWNVVETPHMARVSRSLEREWAAAGFSDSGIG